MEINEKGLKCNYTISLQNGKLISLYQSDRLTHLGEVFREDTLTNK